VVQRDTMRPVIVVEVIENAESRTVFSCCTRSPVRSQDHESCGNASSNPLASLYRLIRDAHLPMHRRTQEQARHASLIFYWALRGAVISLPIALHFQLRMRSRRKATPLLMRLLRRFHIRQSIPISTCVADFASMLEAVGDSMTVLLGPFAGMALPASS
jgi:hypothetical protein